VYNFSGAATDILRRVVYPPFTSLWALVRDLPGRRRRRKASDVDVRSAQKRRDVAAWNESRGR